MPHAAARRAAGRQHQPAALAPARRVAPTDAHVLEERARLLLQRLGGDHVHSGAPRQPPQLVHLLGDRPEQRLAAR